MAASDPELLIARSYRVVINRNMIRWLLAILIGITVLALRPTAQAAPLCTDSETACVLEAAWGAALLLPEEKRARLQPLFLEIATRSGDPVIIKHWHDRWPDARRASSGDDYPDFGWTKAESILAKEGVDGLIAKARAKQAPLHFGRSDILLSAGKRLLAERPGDAARLNAALIDLSASASDFERPELAHAAAELAMVRCDMQTYERAMARVLTSQNLRYAFWRARIKGDLSDLLSRVRNEADETDTRHVRQVLDGYRAISEYGYCTGKTGDGDA